MSITSEDNIGTFYSRRTGGRFLYLMITENLSLDFDRHSNGISWNEWVKGEMQYHSLYPTYV